MPVALHESVRNELLERMCRSREQSDALFRVVLPDSLYERPIPERHRILFYVGHLEAFDWNLLAERVFGLKSPHPEFDHLFAFGIDPVGGGLPDDRASDWPSVDAVRAYVRSCQEKLDVTLTTGLVDSHANTRDGFTLDTLLQVAIEHRLMHVETLAYMLHQLPLSQKIQQATASRPETPAVSRRMIAIPAGTATLGLARGNGVFGWDNEYDLHSVDVPAFAIDQCMVTNGQYLDFVNAGGYEARELWSDEAWAWKNQHGISYPVFWKKTGTGWNYRAMFSELVLPLNWPAYVSHAEASAYARWAGKFLPTEPEWHRAAYGTVEGYERPYPWGNDAPEASLGNFDLHAWDPAAVNAFPRGRSAFGVLGLLGNGWEWTSTEFAPFPGFEPFPFYRGYSADFFDGKHFVMKGGSPRTAACMLRSAFRNWFQPHYQYAYAGFRCVAR